MRGRVILKDALNEDAAMALLDARGLAGLDVLTRLTLNADADGRFIAEGQSLPGLLYPKRPMIRSLEDLEADLNAMSNAGIVRLYEHNGVRYGQLLKWFEQQSKPDQRWYSPSKLPAPRGFRGKWTWDSTTRATRENHACNTRESRVPHACFTESSRRDHGVNTALELEVEVEVEEEVEEEAKSCLSSDSKKETESSERPRVRKKKAGDTRVKGLVDYFFQTLQAKIGSKPKMPFDQMGKWIAASLKDDEPEHLKEVWHHWLASEDGWAKEHAWDWRQFHPNFNAVELALKEGKPYGHKPAGRNRGLYHEPSPESEFVTGRDPFRKSS